jgi:hypothetical protein
MKTKDTSLLGFVDVQLCGLDESGEWIIKIFDIRLVQHPSDDAPWVSFPKVFFRDAKSGKVKHQALLWLSDNLKEKLKNSALEIYLDWKEKTDEGIV